MNNNTIRRRIPKNSLNKPLKNKKKFFVIPLTFGKGLKISIVEIKRKFLANRRQYAAICLVAVLMLTSSMFVYKNYIAKGATYGWLQTDWSGGVATTTATHTNNQENWTYFSSKTDNVSTAGGTLTQTSASPDVWIETTDTDFVDHGTATSTGTYITGGKVYPKKSVGATCSSNSECLNVPCVLGICDSSWLSGPCSGIVVKNVDSGMERWKSTRTNCVSPQCLGGALVDDNSVDFGTYPNWYPARNICKQIGGRLPINSELLCILSNKSSYGNNFYSNSYYWTSGQSSLENAIASYSGVSISEAISKDSYTYIRCVISL